MNNSFKHEFFDGPKACSIFLAKGGKAYLSGEDGPVDLSNKPPLFYLNYWVTLENDYSVDDLFQYLASFQESFQAVISEVNFSEYINYWRKLNAASPVIIPSKKVQFLIRYFLLYSNGEDWLQRKRKEEILNERAVELFTENKIHFYGASEEESDDFMANLDREAKAEIKLHLKAGTYESLCRSQAYTSRRWDCSVVMPEEKDKRGRSVYNSVSAYKLSFLRSLPIVVGESVIISDDDESRDNHHIPAMKSLTLMDLISAIFWELAWESPEGRESGALATMLSERMDELGMGKDSSNHSEDSED